MPKEVYKLNDGDKEIFALSLKDPNYFTDFYMRSPTTGTWWRNVDTFSETPEIQEVIEKWDRGYKILHRKWMELKQPEFFDHGDRKYHTVFENDLYFPAFHHHHGFVFLPWQRDLYFAKQNTRIVIGGYGAAKSYAEMVCNLIRMARLRYYRCFVIAPYSIQAMEIFQQAKILLIGTEYEERFVKGSFVSRPFPKIIVRNDVCIESTMEFYSLDHPEKILNLSGDSFHVEQAEQINDLDWLMEIMAGRLRGHVAGRERLGIISMIANSDEAGNPQLWDYFDEGVEDEDKKRVDSTASLSLAPTTFDNIYITPRQLMEIEKRMGKDQAKRDRALKGIRPIGSGEHFSSESILRCRDNDLDLQMELGRKTGNDQFVLQSVPKAQVIEWRLPPNPSKTYLLAADPGWANPPHRNSAAMMVFDITEFPRVPAQLVAFSWVYGNNSPDPWIMKYMELCAAYHCVGRNAFDSTGPQSGYSHMVHGLNDLNPWPVNTGGGKKYIYLNAAKTLVSRGKFQFPNIPMLFAQMSKYKLPDDKLRQDLVMTLMIAGAYLDYMFYNVSDEEVVEDPAWMGRYGFHKRGVSHER